MSYTPKTFNPFAPLPASDMNIMAANDASFNDGTGVASLSHAVTAIYNPYKFSVYLSADQTGIADATFTKVQFNTELFDTNSNYDNATNYRYTAPVTGFYQINAYTSLVSSNNTAVAGIISLYKNGVEFIRGDLGNPTVGGDGVVFGGGLSEFIQLTATDYIEIFIYIDTGSGTRLASGSAGSKNNRFSGFLVSRT